MNNILDFIHLSEKLKTEKRNGFTSSNKKESVADHCWRVSLMVILLGSYLDGKINTEKCLKLAIIHDLAEIITGDTPYFVYKHNKKMQQEKHINELTAMKKLVKDLPTEIKNEILDLWNEFESCSSNEAKFVLALDKLEAQIQHNESDASNWSEDDIKYAPTLLDPYCFFDSFLEEFKTLVQNESKIKIDEIIKQN